MEVRDLVRNYLLNNVGNMAVAGEPFFDHALSQWRVPVLCRTERGLLLAGEMCLNPDLEFVSVPTKEDLVHTVEVQLKRLPFLIYAEEGELEAAGFEPIKA